MTSEGLMVKLYNILNDEERKELLNDLKQLLKSKVLVVLRDEG